MDATSTDYKFEEIKTTLLKEAHDRCDEIENLIKRKISNSEINIHMETLGSD